MRNSSQRPGCMRRLPASHSCQPRSVQCISAAAAVCDSPAASRAARTSADAGFAEGPFGPRFGWLGIGDANFEGVASGRYVGVVATIQRGDGLTNHAFAANDRARNEAVFAGLGLRDLGAVIATGAVANGDFGGGHFVSPVAPIPRRGGQQRAAHELNYTRIACNRKSFLHKFNEAPTPPHNARDNPPSVSEGRVD